MDPVCFRRVLSDLRQPMARAGRSAVLASAAWLWMTARSWAQPFEQEVEEKTYVPSYMIIIFAVGLALLMICRSGKRSTSFRREE